MPAGVEDLLREVQRIHLHRVPQTWPRYPVLSSLIPGQRSTNLLCLERRLVGLQNNVVKGVRIVYPEVVVVRSGQYMPNEVVSGEMEPSRQLRYALIISTPYALKLVEDAIVLVEIAELAS